MQPPDGGGARFGINSGMTGQDVFGWTRATALAAALLGLLALATLLSPSPALGQSNAPATPTSVSITRANGTLTATWPAVDGATRYHVTYTSDNTQSWTAAASPADNHSDSAITIDDVDNAKTYIVGVRAGNANDQWSGWRNSEPAGPFQSTSVSIQGPMGEKVSADLARHQSELFSLRSRRCQSRALTSLPQV